MGRNPKSLLSHCIGKSRGKQADLQSKSVQLYLEDNLAIAIRIINHIPIDQPSQIRELILKIYLHIYEMTYA